MCACVCVREPERESLKEGEREGERESIVMRAASAAVTHPRRKNGISRHWLDHSPDEPEQDPAATLDSDIAGAHRRQPNAEPGYRVESQHAHRGVKAAQVALLHHGKRSDHVGPLVDERGESFVGKVLKLVKLPSLHFQVVVERAHRCFPIVIVDTFVHKSCFIPVFPHGRIQIRADLFLNSYTQHARRGVVHWGVSGCRGEWEREARPWVRARVHRLIHD